MQVTKDDIKKAVAESGLAGGIICIHSSLSSFGEIIGGAETVIKAFLESGCTVLAPSFTYDFQISPLEVIEQNRHEDILDASWQNGRIFNPGIKDIAPDMGAIPRFMVNADGRLRGNHPTNSFVALGPEAEELISCQAAEDVYAPFQKMMEKRGKIILMGVDLTKMTALHYAEQLSGRELFIRWALDEQGEPMRIREGSCSEGFNNLNFAVAELEENITVGNSVWRIFPILETVNACAEAIRQDSGITHCDNENCLSCNDMQKGGPVLY